MYNRDYLSDKSSNEESYSSSYEQEQSRPEDLVGFLKATYKLFAASLMAASVGVYVGMGMTSIMNSWHIGLFILEIALLFGLYAVKEKPGINLAVLFAFTFVTGLTITPLLSSVFNMPGGAGIVGQAFLMTSVAFGGISMFALTTKRDFSNMGKFLFIAIIIFIVGMISNMFIQSTGFQLALAMGGALLFSAFILYDTQQIIKGGYDSPIIAAVSLYLDFLNLFVMLVQILGIFNNKDD